MLPLPDLAIVTFRARPSFDPLTTTTTEAYGVPFGNRHEKKCGPRVGSADGQRRTQCKTEKTPTPKAMKTMLSRVQIRNNVRIFASLAAAGLLLAATASATPTTGQANPKAHDKSAHHRGPGMGGRLFERWDNDRDGKVTLAELPARMQKHLSTVDTNKDGILTRAEFDAGKAQLKAQHEKAFDKNGDGKVTDEERREAMRAHLVERFVEQDKNHDGYLTETEVQNPHWAHLKNADANSDSRVTLEEMKVAFEEGKLRPRHGGKGPRSHADMKAHAQERFTADDKNKDGALTESEIPARWAHFKAADANQDNKITFDELTAAFKSGKFGKRGPHRDHQGRAK